MTEREFLEFTPFDDTQERVYIPTDVDTGGMQTSEIDPFRQGVEIKTNRQRFVGMQPKIWAGNLDHFTKVQTIGQARSYTEYENNRYFEDMLKFNAVVYIQQGPNYPLPIVFNEGPQQEEEASIEPITIPYRKLSPEGPFFAHRVAGAIEDGNNLDTIYRNANRITQFVDYDDPVNPRWFLDEGTNYWGEPSNAIVIDGYISGDERTLRPFDDTSLDDVPQNIANITSDMFDILVRMKMNLNMDFRPVRSRSANANTFVYGRDAAIYGTDSMAFVGLTRGT